MSAIQTQNDLPLVSKSIMHRSKDQYIITDGINKTTIVSKPGLSRSHFSQRLSKGPATELRDRAPCNLSDVWHSDCCLLIYSGVFWHTRFSFPSSTYLGHSSALTIVIRYLRLFFMIGLSTTRQVCYNIFPMPYFWLCCFDDLSDHLLCVAWTSSEASLTVFCISLNIYVYS